MSEIVMTSGLDWTTVRFLAPTDARQPKDPARVLRRRQARLRRHGADIATFTAAQLDDDRYVNAAPAISN